MSSKDTNSSVDPSREDSCESDDESDIECEICEKIFSDVKSFEQHLKSKRHYKALKKKDLTKKYKPSETSKTDNGDASESEEPTCDVCQKTFSGIESYVRHIKSEIHAKNVRKQELTASLANLPEMFFTDAANGKNSNADIVQKPFARCPVCKKSFTGPEGLDKHIKSHKHGKNVKVKQLMEELKVDDANGEDFACQICQKKFTGFIPYETHMQSHSHRKELLKAEAEKTIKDLYVKDETDQQYVCNECKKPFPDPFAFKIHLDNDSHAKQKMKGKIFDFVAANPEIAAVKSIQSNVSEDAEDEAYPSGIFFLVCKLCHMSFTGPQNASDHVNSKKHKKVVAEKKNKLLLKQKMNSSKERSDTNGVAKTPSATVPSNTEKDSGEEDEGFEIISN